MKLNARQFLGLEPEYTSYEEAAVAVLPFPYEGGISYGAGTALAPEAVIEASGYLELYDEVLDSEPYRMGITTLKPPTMPDSPEEMIRLLQSSVAQLLEHHKFPVVIGGDHSISSGFCRALFEHYGKLSVIQLDAHSDLRLSYEGSPLSHASVMSRIREITPNTLQIGIRSMCAEEAKLIKAESIQICTMSRFREGTDALRLSIETLPDPVFITVDVDVFDWSVIASTGTPEPGGMLWDEALRLLSGIFSRKNVVGFDVVELAYRDHDPNSPFAVAKLIYKMLGFMQSGLS